MLRKKVLYWGTSLVVQWLRILLAVQGTLVQSLVRDLRAYMLQATKSMCHNYRAHALWSLHAATKI